MSVYRRAAVIVVLPAAIALIIAGCGHSPGEQSGKILVAASIPPLADFARRVGGNHVQVETLVPPGASPHTFQITPKQMEFVGKADLLVLNGLNLEMWARQVVDAAENPRLVVVDTSKGISTLGSTDQHEVGANPHIWLDPIRAIRQVEAIRSAMIKVDPAHRRDYESNARRYIARLKQLDKDIRRQVNTFKSKDFVAFHPAWVYLAQRYGLVEAGVIEANPGREPSVKELAGIVKTARRLHARVVFAEPQFSPKAAEMIAEATGAKVMYLDPLGKPPDYDYINTMRWNLKQMAKALK